MENYDNVSNPFITLKKLSGPDESSFTAKLNSSPPSVDNDKYMSNMKKAKDSFYSDNRAEKMRDDSTDSDYDKYTVTLMDIDNILYEYFINVINPQVEDTNNSILSVPVRHASPERWTAIQRDGVYRDSKGMVQKPMIIFSRTSVSNDDSFAHFNRHLNVPFVKKFTKKNMYDKFSAMTGAKPSQEIHNIAFPDHVILNYDFTMTTEYVQQMNTLVELVNWASNDYWGDSGRLKFRASVDSFNNNVETPSDDDRTVTTTFSLTVNAYLLPEVFNNTKTKQRGLTYRKAIFATEVEGSSLNSSQNKPQSVMNAGFTKYITLNRKNSNAFISGDIGDEYEIRLWNDEEFYTMYIEDVPYKISSTLMNEETVLIFNYETNNEVILNSNDQHELVDTSTNKKIKIETHKMSVDILKIKYIS